MQADRSQDIQKLRALTASLRYTIKEQERTLGYLNEILRVSQEQLDDSQHKLCAALAELEELTGLTESLVVKGAADR
jgi:uncharacterized coiled-coil protein SlyX